MLVNKSDCSSTALKELTSITVTTWCLYAASSLYVLMSSRHLESENLGMISNPMALDGLFGKI